MGGQGHQRNCKAMFLSDEGSIKKTGFFDFIFKAAVQGVFVVKKSINGGVGIHFRKNFQNSFGSAKLI